VSDFAWARLVVRRLRAEYPEARCALVHADPFQLIVATILSAQCTDAMVNRVTPALFKRYPAPDKLARARPATVEKLIHSTGFFRNKTRNILAMATRLVADHEGLVPRTMEELLALPGVARKTANVVLGVAFGKAEGVVVDTHVKRIANLLGLTSETDPARIERDLMAQLPRKAWIDFSHLLIWHGRRICIARRRDCDACVLQDRCPGRL